MALAKYYEDNLELYDNRMSDRDDNSFFDIANSQTASITHINLPKKVSFSKIIFEKRICPCCGKEFSISLGEALFFSKKDLHLPKKCKSCRKKAKSSTKISTEKFFYV